MNLPLDYDRQRAYHYILEHSAPWANSIQSFEDLVSDDPALNKWKDYSNMSKNDFIQLVWGGSNGYFPQFCEFLSQHLMCLFLGNGPYGHTLIYFLEGTIRFDDEDFLDSILIGGLPSIIPSMEKIESDFGKLPNAYKGIIENHSFFVCRNNSVVCSFEMESVIEGGGPKIYEFQDYKEETTQFLSVANCWENEVFCFKRNDVGNAWGDSVVKVNKKSRICEAQSYLSIDELLISEF